MNAKKEVVPFSEKLMLSVPEAAALVGVGRTLFYQAMKDGLVRPVKFGRRTLIPRTEAESLLARLAAGGRHNG